MFDKESLQNRLKELDRIEEGWKEEQKKMESQIEQLLKEKEDFFKIKPELLKTLRLLEAELACAQADKSASNNTKQESPVIPEHVSETIDTSIPKDFKEESPTSAPSEKNPVIMLKSEEKPVLPEDNEEPESKDALAPKGRSKTGKKGRATKSKQESIVLPPPEDIDMNIPFDYSLKWTLNAHLDSVRAICFHPTLQLLATASDDGTIRLFNLDPPKPAGKKVVKNRQPQNYLSLRGHSSPIISLAAKDNFLFSGSVDGTINIWDFSNPKSIQLYDVFGQVNHHIVQTISVCKDSVFSIVSHENSPYVVALSSDGYAWMIKVSDFSVESIKIDEHPSAVSFSIDGLMFAIGCMNGTVFIQKGSETINRIDTPSHIYSITSISDSLQYAIACEDAMIRIINIANESIVKEIRVHESPVSGIISFLGSNFLITTSHDKSIRAWRNVTYDSVYSESLHKDKYGEAGLCLASTTKNNQGCFFASGGADGTVKVFSKSK